MEDTKYWSFTYDDVGLYQTVKQTGTTSKTQSSQHMVSTLRRLTDHPPAERYFLVLPYELQKTRMVSHMSVQTRVDVRDTYPGLPANAQYYSYVYTGQPPRVRMPVATIPVANDGPLINACIQAVKDEKVNLGILFAELRDTVNFLGRTASRISSAYAAIRRGKFSKASRILRCKTPPGVDRSKHWSQNYLAYNFAVIPLIEDAKGIARHLAERGLEQPLFTVTAKYEEIVPSTGVRTEKWPAPGHQGSSFLIRDEIVTTTRHQVVLKFNVMDSFWREIAQLGLINPVSLRYDTIPLSFVLGWFSSVGACLDYIDVFHGLMFRSGGYTRMQTQKVISNLIDHSLTLNSYERQLSKSDVTISRGEYEAVVLRREVYPNMPPPQLLFHLPLSNEVSKAITSVALVRQRLK